MDSNANIENAIAGRYNFQISAIFGEAWEKTSGFKARFWKAFILIFFITLILSIIAFSIDYMIQGAPEPNTEGGAPAPRPIFNLIEMIFSIFVTTPLFAGLIMLSIKQCAGIALPSGSVFNYFSYWKKLWVYPVAMTIISLLQSTNLPAAGFISFITFLLTIFIGVTYFMFIPLVADKNLPIWDALEASRKTIFHHWFKTLWFIILLILISIGSLLTLGIAFIWTLPWIYNAIGVLYKNMFGVQP